MAHPTPHIIDAKISMPLGDGEDSTLITVRIKFDFLPEWKPDGTDPGAAAEVEFDSAKLIDDGGLQNPPQGVDLEDLCRDWLADEGYEPACQIAERERHGDWE
jgi:hypothetical protein